MKVILKQEIEGLGTIGEIVKVKDGYGRNFLIPQGLAILASEKNVKAIEGEKRRLAKVRANNLVLAEKLKAELAPVHLSFLLQAGEDGKVFGSITSNQVGEALAEKGFNIDRRKIQMGNLNKIGIHVVPIKIFHDVVGEIKVEIKTAESDQNDQNQAIKNESESGE